MTKKKIFRFKKKLSISQTGTGCLINSERQFVVEKRLPRCEVQPAPVQPPLSDHYSKEAVGYLSL